MAKVTPDYLSHFEKADPLVFGLMNAHGPFQIRLERNRFRMLVRSIIGQQLSVSAARTIFTRLEDSIRPGLISPESVSAFTVDEMRVFGLSGKKAEYVLDLSLKASDGTLRLATIGRMSDEQIVEHLVQVRGIGRWTAQMFLIFALGRIDVFPHEDLGVRSAIKRLYGMAELPDRTITEEVQKRWSPFSSIASWYCWRSIDAPKS